MTLTQLTELTFAGYRRCTGFELPQLRSTVKRPFVPGRYDISSSFFFFQSYHGLGVVRLLSWEILWLQPRKKKLNAVLGIKLLGALRPHGMYW